MSCRHSFFCRVLALCLVLWWMVMPGGCAPFGENPALKLPSYDLHVRLQHQKIAVLVHSVDKLGGVDLPVKSRAGGALYGAGEGFATVLGSFGGGACEGAGCGIVVLAVLSIAVVGGLVGAVAGAIDAPSKKQSSDMEQALDAGLNRVAQRDLAQKLEDEALLDTRVDLHIVTTANPEHEHQAGYSGMRQLGYDSVLDLYITRIEFEGGKGTDPELTLNLEVDARLIELNSSAKPYRRTFSYVSHPAPFSWWVSGDGTKTRRVFDNGTTLLARQIFQGVFVRFGPAQK